MRNLISETKVDNAFPVSQFCVPRYSVPFRLDRTEKGGGVIYLLPSLCGQV